MRFSLRTLMIICFLVTVTVGWLGLRYIKWKREQQLLADLYLPIYADYPSLAFTNEEKFERYSPDRLFKIADLYSEIAEREPPDSVAARIASGALVHLGSEYDKKPKELIRDPRAIKIAERVFDSKIEPLAAASTMILMEHHRLSDDVHSSQYLRTVIEDGYDSDNPLDVYLLATEVYSDFQYADREFGIEENWPTPKHPWDWNLGETPSHTYEDKIDALRQVSPDAADAYAAIIEELRTCNGKPSVEQRATIDEYSRDGVLAMDVKTIFRFMLRNLETFKSQPDLCLPPLSDPEASPADS